MAKTLHDRIEEEDFVAFLDTEDIRAGEDWAEFILGSLKASDYFVLLLSEDANTSEMVLKEVLAARKLKAQYGKPIILPVKVQWPEGLSLNHKLSNWLQRIQHLQWGRGNGHERSNRKATGCNQAKADPQAYTSGRAWGGRYLCGRIG